MKTDIEIPVSWLPDVAMKRIIIHWTAGAHKANSIDRSHYHILVEGDGKLVKGTHSIADNVNTRDGRYAAHTLGCNTSSIGVSMCCMAGCREKPFYAGTHPMTEKQWYTCMNVCAILCQKYSIPVTAQTVLNHGEVQHNLGIAQRGKWDALVLPWATWLTKDQVGDLCRETIINYLEPPSSISVNVLGKVFSDTDAIMLNESSYVALRPVCNAFGWKIVHAKGETFTLQMHSKTVVIDGEYIDSRGFVSCRDLAELLGESILWDHDTRTVIIG